MNTALLRGTHLMARGETSGEEAAGSGGLERAPSVGSIGYTGSYRERSVDIVDVSVVSVLEARGPE